MIGACRRAHAPSSSSTPRPLAHAPWVPPGGSLHDAVVRFDEWLRETPRIGLWIDSSELTIEETVDEILSRWGEAKID